MTSLTRVLSWHRECQAVALLCWSRACSTRRLDRVCLQSCVDSPSLQAVSQLIRELYKYKSVSTSQAIRIEYAKCFYLAIDSCLLIKIGDGFSSADSASLEWIVTRSKADSAAIVGWKTFIIRFPNWKAESWSFCDSWGSFGRCYACKLVWSLCLYTELLHIICCFTEVAFQTVIHNVQYTPEGVDIISLTKKVRVIRRMIGLVRCENVH